MKRTTFDATKEGGGAAPIVPEDLQPCRRCKTFTAWGTLSDHGGLCYPCYAAYCREDSIAPPVSRSVAVQALRRLRIGKEHSKAWAHALKAREESGEQLTPFQASAWREALSNRHSTDGDEACDR